MTTQHQQLITDRHGLVVHGVYSLVNAQQQHYIVLYTTLCPLKK